MFCEGQCVEISVFLKPFKFGRSQTPKGGFLPVSILGFVKVDIEKGLLYSVVFIRKVASFCVSVQYFGLNEVLMTSLHLGWARPQHLPVLLKLQEFSSILNPEETVF